ncbi:lipoyl synthase [Striga asiatica]|uniref:Lipoyl synthase n=1 Tax=Striga asiatica TaxID=4170 RepID=A0A5A7PFV3_STRAF|nr:lipoyl synthase [Striga asiatica]
MATNREFSDGLVVAYPVCAADNTAGALRRHRTRRLAGGSALSHQASEFPLPPSPFCMIIHRLGRSQNKKEGFRPGQVMLMSDVCTIIMQIDSINPDKEDEWISSSYAYLIEDKVQRMDVADGSSTTVKEKQARLRSWKLRIKGLKIEVLCKGFGDEEQSIEPLFFRY